MSPEQTIWLLSMLGALLFIGVGFFGARATYVREGPRGPRPEPRISRENVVDRGELERARQQLHELKEVSTAALEEARALDGQLRSSIEDREQMRSALTAMELDLAESVRVATELKSKLDAQKKESSALESKLEALRAEKAEVRELAAKREEAALRQEIAALKSRLETQRVEMREEAAALKSRLEAQRVEAESLREEAAALKSRLGAHRAEAEVLREEKAAVALALEDAERLAQEGRSAEELAKQTADLDLELAAARAKLADLDRLREENARLRQAAADSSVLRSEVKRLEEEQVELKARAFAQPMDPAKELPVAPTSPGAFEKIAAEVAQSARARSVAIADELGFTIAGVGTEHEGLAALCGLLGEIERRAQLLLPVGAVRRITLEMDHGAGVSVCPIAKSDTRISLATLTVGPRPDTVSLTGAVEKASELLFR